MRNLLTLFYFTFFVLSLNAQPVIYFSPSSSDAAPTSNQRSSNPLLNQILDDYNVVQYEFAFVGFADVPVLAETCILRLEPFDSKIVDDLLSTRLFNWVEEVNIYLNESATCPTPYLPNDPLSQPEAGNRWVVDELGLDCAWSINSGCGDQKIAFVDLRFEADHPEIVNQLCDSVIGTSSHPDFHGLKTSSIAIAEENEFGITGVNPNGKFYALNGWNRIEQASNLDGVRVINYSWINALGQGLPAPPCIDQFNSQYYGTVLPTLIEEVTRKGITFVLASGDIQQSDSGWCTIRDLPGVIFVSGVRRNPWTGIVDWSTTTARNSSVDILAPASTYFRAEPNGQVAQYNGPGGNSAATAFMSGVVSLLYCENPCLLPGDVENILSLSGQPVPAMAQFPDELGVGLVSVDVALELAHVTTPFPEVTGQVSIDAPTNVHSDITVKDGGTLTITSLVHFNDPDHHIIVEKGGKLILDNAHLRNGCDNDTWGGVRVLGNPHASQYVPAGNVDQGFVEATNSIIENASMAIALSGEYFSNLGGGGICIANGLTVKNCLRGVAMDMYPRKLSSLPHQLLPNRTIIRNSHFFIDDDYPFPNGFQINILMSDISTNTNITNTRIADERSVFTQDIETIGLLSHSSKFNVLSNSEFNNLSYGVKASTLYNTNNFRVKESVFNNCFIGVSTRNVPFAMIEDNDFFVGGYQGTTANFEFPDQPTGLILDHSTGFRVEGNLFDGEAGVGLNPLGILSRNTSFGNTLLDYNEIKENDFTKLRSGNLANENNGGNGQLGGLLYKCNKNYGDNEEDITVAFGSVAQNQTYIDNQEVGIDNQLSNWDNGNPFSDIDNATQGGLIRYYYSNGPSLEPVYFPAASVLPISSGPGCFEEDPCPKCVRLSDPKRDELIAFIQNEDPVFQSHYSIYKGKMDGGNTPGLIADLSSTQNWPTGVANAMALAPYISSEASEIIRLSAIIPIQSKLDVFYQNPEVVQHNDIWDWIVQNVHSSTYTLNQFEQVRLQMSIRGQEELDLETMGRPLIQTATALIRHYLYQDENTSSDLNAAAMYIDKYFSPEIALGTYLQSGNWTKATDMINVELQTNTNLELWTFYQLLQSDLVDDDLSLSSVPLTDQANLLVSTNITSNLQIGRNLLTFIGHNPEFQNEGIFDKSIRNTKQKSIFEKGQEKDMIVYPNPVNKDIVTIQLPDKKIIRGKIELYNSLGRLVYSSGVKDQIHTMSIEGMPSGVYIIQLDMGEGDILAQQLIVH